MTRMPEAYLSDIAVRSHAHGMAKGAGKMADTEMHRIREFLQRNPPVEVSLDMARNTVDLPCDKATGTPGLGDMRAGAARRRGALLGHGLHRELRLWIVAVQAPYPGWEP